MMASKNLRTSEEADDRLSTLPADRLSTLPDGVISHILSFLPTKFAATTSALSKRWRKLFHSVSHIDLDEAWQMYPSDERSHHRMVFHQFVNRLLLSPDSKAHIQSLRLRCKIQHENEAINGWIRAAIGRHVEELDVLASLNRSETLPSDVFNSKNLRILRLHGTFIFDVPTSARMPNLMPNLVNLHLEYAQFVDGSCLRSGFPVLKHLRLCHCRMTNDNKVLELVSPSLTNLILHKGYEDYKIDLHAPNLECLEYSAYGPEFLEVKEKLTRLIRADIDFEVRDEGIEPEAQVEKVLVYGLYAKKLMMEICEVRSLRLTGGSLEALCYSTYPLPTFHNLTIMELGANHIVGWRPLAKFLESSPNLEVLNFEQGLIDRSGNKLVFERVLPGIVPACLSEHLREIKVGDFIGQRCEFELLAYFLKRGKVLEEIKICSKTFWGWPSSFCEKLLKYRRCSKTCKIVVSWMADEIFCNRCIN